MNYFTYSTVLSVFLVFLATRSDGLQKFPVKPKVIETKECPKDLEIYKPNTNGQWPAKVVNPKFHVPSESPGLDITWTADTKNVKGFKIVLKPSGKDDICRILDYSDIIGGYPQGVYSFEFSFNRIFQNRTWHAELYALPSRDNSSEVIKFNTNRKNEADIEVVKRGVQVNEDIDCNFAPYFDHDYDGKYMEVIFTKGPAACKFEEYKVRVLYQNDSIVTDQIIRTQDNVDKLRAYFQLDICEGYYSLLVSVYDRFFNDRSKCVCKSGSACVSCPHTESKDFYLVPEKSCTPKIVTDKSVKPDENKLLYPLGVVIGLLFLIALALYIAFWRLSVLSMVRKRGIVLLLDDHEHHTNAVTKVVDYLNEYHLKVYLASSFLQNSDIPDQMVVIGEVLKSDFVLLVLSPALEKRMEAWDKQQDYVEFFKEKNSNILSKAFLEVVLHSNKLFVCKFDHAAEFGSWPKPCYSLPSDLTRMVEELSEQNFSQRLILCNCLKSNSLRRELQIAIKKTIMYEQSYPNWFLKKYVCPKQFFPEEPIQGESIGHYETVNPHYETLNPQKLKELFTGYKETSIRLPEENMTVPSIYSIPISEEMEQINITHL